MPKTLTATASETIDAPAGKVWGALIDPKQIKQYMFGADVKEGSPIVYKGEWEGKSFEDKGKVLEIEPRKRLVSTFWSALAGLPDKPENYKTVGYELAAEGDRTKLTITQDNNASQDEAREAEKNWRMVLDGIKKLVEG